MSDGPEEAAAQRWGVLQSSCAVKAGRAVEPVELPEITTGRAEYGLDVRLPGIPMSSEIFAVRCDEKRR